MLEAAAVKVIWAGGVCDVNSLTGLILPIRPNDQTLVDLEDCQAP